MPEEIKHHAISPATTMQAGFMSSMITFAIRWIPECKVNRSIVNGAGTSNTWRSYANIGILWDLGYRVPANTFGFPAQYHLKEACFKQLDERYHTRSNKIAIHALTGWAAAMLEAALFYPLDSMRTLAQIKPDIFNGRSFHYFLTHQAQLRRGIGITLVRNTLTNITGWSAKAATETSFEKTEMSLAYQTLLSSIAFAFTRIFIGYPLTTLGILLQTDTSVKTTHSLKEKYHHTLQISQNRLKEKGFLSLYQGFALKGGAQIATACLQMWLFSWWIHPNRKPLSRHSFFSATEKKSTLAITIDQQENTHENRR
ncbi:MAG: MC/SLC25 family protein [Coxiellaceae bacterium]|nr:MC/SLC25 family protein [Coxiellaceae bacterium]